MPLNTFKAQLTESLVAYQRVLQNAETHESLVEYLARFGQCIRETQINVSCEYKKMMRPRLEHCKPETVVWSAPGQVSMDPSARFRATAYDFSEPLSDKAIRKHARRGKYGSEAQRVATESATTREKRDDARRHNNLVQDILSEYME